jgi:simple sugar transport system permease protein
MDIWDILHGALRMATPIGLAALGGVFTHRAGVLNIAIEGMMLISAFVGVITSYATGSVTAALLAAIAVSVVIGLIFSFFGVTLQGNIIITGLAVNIFALGITSFILQSAFGMRGSLSSPKIVGLKPVDMPWLGGVPVIGPILNNQTPIVYAGLLISIIVSIVLYKTKFGLYVRVVGENEDAARSMGIRVSSIKYGAVAISAVLSALAGVNLSLENLTMFVENMTSGRGFIALAAIFCGQGTPGGAYTFSFLFGLADAVQMRLQGFNVPGAFIQMIPYLFIVVILGVAGIMRNRGNTQRGIRND